MAEATRKVRLFKVSVLLGVLATSAGLALAGCSDSDDDKSDGSADSSTDGTSENLRRRGTRAGLQSVNFTPP